LEKPVSFEGNAMQLNAADPNEVDLEKVKGPVPTLPNPGKIYVCGNQVEAHIAISGLVNCTAIFLYHAISGARAMMHYNPFGTIGPVEKDVKECLDYLNEKYTAPKTSLKVSLYNKIGVSESAFKTDKLKGILESAFGPEHTNIIASHYKFDAAIALMDASGTVWACKKNKLNWTIEGVDFPDQGKAVLFKN
jgi:hypothetical protein